ncbi:MAG: hypothetical protein HC775_19575 [Hyellaceae cyanobacterium CSU_1_1]|nr:hypothetical protein [Hyellaceae cyanobacterium CSU_1_1]
MNVRDRITLSSLQFLGLGLGLGATLVAVFNPLAAQETPSIKIDGSSTVYPITKKIVEDYQASQKKPVEIEIEFSGTGGGFDKFCSGETEINNASRPIQLDEMETCREAGVAYIELPLARPLFIYVNAAAARKNKELVRFTQFYLKNAPEVVGNVGYVSLPDEAYQINEVTFYRGEVGTVFDGQSQFNVTIPELLRKQAQY